MIRTVTPEDYPAIYEIYRWYVLHSDAIFDLIPESRETFYRRLDRIAQNYPVLAAVHEGKLIGYGYTHAAFEKDAYQFNAELTIYFVQGRHYGLAGALLETLEEISYRQNIRWLISCITETNHQSIVFNEKHGFQKTGFLSGCGLKNGKWLSVIWMAKALHEEKEYMEKDLSFVPFSRISM